MNRRNFLTQTVIGTTGASVASSAFASLLISCSDKNRIITMALLGCNEKGIEFVNNIKDIENVVLKYIFDFDDQRIQKAANILGPVLGYTPVTAQDMNIVFNDKEVDGVFIFLPEHWRAQSTILACDARKDVYVDSLPAHTIWEGQQMVKTAHKYKRIVQCGFPLRNSPGALSAKEFISGGNLGQVVHVRVFGLRERNEVNIKQHTSDQEILKYGNNKDETEPQLIDKIPESLDWEGWLGTVPYRSFHIDIYKPEISDNCKTYWDFNSGLMTGTIYGLDIARMVTGDPGHPASVYGYGRGTGWQNESGITERQIVTYDYKYFTMVCESGNGYNYMKRTALPFRKKGELISLNWLSHPERVEIYGTSGLMYIDTIMGSWQVIGNKGDIIAEKAGIDPDKLHMQNFIDCIRNRELPGSNINQGHLSTTLTHLGNIACRVGNKQLIFNSGGETFENNEDANALIGRKFSDSI